MADTAAAPTSPKEHVSSSPMMSLAGKIDQGATGDSKPSPKPSSSKTKKTATKPRKAAAPLPEHPKYSAMIGEAICHLKERGGSSRQAILKYIMSRYNLGEETKKINARVKVSLKAGVKLGTLKQSKGTGASGSFRLGDRKKHDDGKRDGSERKANKPRSKITKVKKPAATTSKSNSKAAKSPKKQQPTAKKTPKKAVTAKSAKSPKKAIPKKSIKAPKSPKKVKTAAAKKGKPAPKKSPAKKPAKPAKSAKKSKK